MVTMAMPRSATLTEARRYCRDLTRREAKNFYFAFLFLDRRKQEAAFAIYAFCRIADDLADDDQRPVRERLEALVEFERGLDDCLSGYQAHHPVFVALQDILTHTAIPPEGFRLLLAGVRQDLSKRRYATFAELEDYCFKVASSVALLLVPIFDPARPGDLYPYARAGGIAVQLTNILRDVAEDAARDRIYLPLEDLARFGVREDDLLAGRSTPELRSLIAFEAERACSFYEEAEGAMTGRDRRQQFVLMTSSAIYRRLLDRMAERDYDVLSTRVRLGALEKLAIALDVRTRSWLGGSAWPLPSSREIGHGVKGAKTEENDSDAYS